MRVAVLVLQFIRKTTLVALVMGATVTACNVAPYRATDGSAHPRGGLVVCPSDEEVQPLLASAAHDIPCALDQVRVVNSCGPRCCKGGLLIAEGCGERVSYTVVSGDDAAQITMIGRVKTSP